MNVKEREKELREDLKRLRGLPPYNEPGNLVWNDGYFYQSLIQKYGKRMVDRVSAELTSCKVIQGSDTSISLSIDEGEDDIPTKASSNPELHTIEDKTNGPSLHELLEKMKSKRKVEPKVSIDEDTQNYVDQYIEVHSKYAELEKMLEELKKHIQPFMKEHDLQEIPGSEGGKVTLVSQQRAPQSTQFTSYEVDDIEEFISPAAKKKCIVRRVDRVILEGMIKTGEVPEEIEELKIGKEVTYFKVDHR